MITTSVILSLFFPFHLLTLSHFWPLGLDLLCVIYSVLVFFLGEKMMMMIGLRIVHFFFSFSSHKWNK